MYTQCPDCATSFRVTAEVLKQAAGKVRCGGCGNAFNALEYLSESKPADEVPLEPDKALPELRPDPFEDVPEDAPPPAAISPEQSAALLKTLDELAGDDIRLEDTGIEWRLMAGDEEVEQGVDEMLDASPTPVDQFLTSTPNQVEAAEVFDEPDAVASDIEIIGESPEAGGNELRFDDNTGLPEDFDFAAANSEPAKPAAADPLPEPIAEEPHPQVDLALGDPDEWGELLSEAIIVPETAEDDGPSIIEELEALVDDVDAPVAGEEAGVAAEAEAPVEPAPTGNQPLDIDTQFGLQAEALGLDLSGAHATDEAAELAAPQDVREAPEPDPTETSIDDDLIAAAFEAEKEAAAALEMSGIQLSLDDDDEPSIIDDLGVLDDEDEEQASIAEELQTLDDEEQDEESAVANELAPFEDDDEPSIADDLIGRDAVYAADSSDDQDDIPDSTSALEFELERAAAEADRAEEVEAAEEQSEEEAELEPGEIDLEAEFLESGTEDAEPESSEADDIEAELALLDGEDDSEVVEDEEFELAEDLAEAVDAAEHVVPPQSEEEQTINMQIDQDLLRLAIEDEEGFASTIVFEKQASGRKRAAPMTETANAPGGADEYSEPKEDDLAALMPEGRPVETIIMEGAFARTAQEQERIEASTDEETGRPAFLAAEAKNSGGSGGSIGRIGMTAGIVLLLLGLGGQFVHQSRAELATIPAVNDAIAPIYRALGMPITPAWDVSGWRFEVTRGSTDDFASEIGEIVEGGGETEPVDGEEAGPVDGEETVTDETATDETAIFDDGPETLTIYSRIGNQSSQPLPYPLVSVSLTDRFEETIGNVVLQPSEYLTGDFDPRRLVPGGETFDAVISIESPSMEATGFKLNVCYRQTGGLLRCAIEDFK